jgi:hypothetical protein
VTKKSMTLWVMKNCQDMFRIALSIDFSRYCYFVYFKLGDIPAHQSQLLKLGNALFLSSLEPGRNDMTVSYVQAAGKTKKQRTAWGYIVECFTHIVGIVPLDVIHDLFIGGDVVEDCDAEERVAEVFHIIQQLVEKYCHEDTIKECGLLIEAMQVVVEKVAPDLPESLHVWIKRFIAKTRLDDSGIAKHAMCLFVATFQYTLDDEFMYVRGKVNSIGCLVFRMSDFT